MKLTIKGNINKYYVQSLCMLFFPGAKFSDSEEFSENVPCADLEVTETGEGVFTKFSLGVGSESVTSETFIEYQDGFTKDRILKISVGRSVFDAGEKLMGVTPPWGILTGVRPAKVASEYLRAGLGIQKTKKLLRSEYFLNPKKASLVTDVASNEAKIVKKLPENTCSVYISVPFCPSRCAYCSFVSYTTKRLLSLVPDYVEAVIKEADDIFSEIKSLGLKVSTVYIGGGTPTILDAPLLEKLLSAVSRNVDVNELMEFTLEAGRPDTITAEKLQIAKSHGVSRISVNPQTLNDEVLQFIGRHHTVDCFFKAYDLALASGIRYINTDLIAGLPGDNFIRFSRSVDKIIEMHPDNITVHTFCVKKASDLLKSETDYFSASGGDTGKSIDYSQVKAKNAKYKPYYLYRNKNSLGNYENVGFAVEGSECLYNIFMMEEVHSIFGIGAGAVTKLVPGAGISGEKIIRIFNPKYPYEYLDSSIEERFAERRNRTESFFSSKKGD